MIRLSFTQLANLSLATPRDESRIARVGNARRIKLAVSNFNCNYFQLCKWRCFMLLPRSAAQCQVRGIMVKKLQSWVSQLVAESCFMLRACLLAMLKLCASSHVCCTMYAVSFLISSFGVVHQHVSSEKSERSDQQAKKVTTRDYSELPSCNAARDATGLMSIADAKQSNYFCSDWWTSSIALSRHADKIKTIFSFTSSSRRISIREQTMMWGIMVSLQVNIACYSQQLNAKSLLMSISMTFTQLANLYEFTSLTK